MNIIPEYYKIIDFEDGETGYTLQPYNSDSSISYTTNFVRSGTRALSVAKTGTSTNEFGVSIRLDDTITANFTTLIFWLRVAKEFEEKIRYITIYWYDTDGNYIIVRYLDKDNRNRWWGVYNEKSEWKVISSGTGKYEYFGFVFQNCNRVDIVFGVDSNTTTIPSEAIVIDRVEFNTRVRVNLDAGETVHIIDVLEQISNVGYYVEKLTNFPVPTFLVRTRIRFTGGGEGTTIYLSKVSILLDLHGAWTRSFLYAIEFYDTCECTVIAGDEAGLSFTNFPQILQIGSGYPWGSTLFFGVNTNVDVRGLAMLVRDEGRIYITNGTLRGIYGTGIHIYPRGNGNRSIIYSSYKAVSTTFWLHSPITVSNDVLTTEGSYIIRVEYLLDGTVRNTRVLGNHSILTRYTYWSSNPPPLTYKYYNVLSKNGSGEVYGFQYWNAYSGYTHHFRHETGMDVKVILVDDAGNPVQGATVRVYGSQSGMLWEATTDSNGETPMMETLIKWWEGDITENTYIYDNDMVDERPHEIEIIWGKAKLRTGLNVFYNDLPLYYQFVIKRYPKAILSLGEVGIIKPTGEKAPLITL